MINPFEYRTIAVGKQFIDRKREIATLRECIKAGQNNTLYSPRRYGKSSLILECFRKIRNEYITVYLDFNRVNSPTDFAEKIIEETARAAYTKIELLVKDMKEFLISLRPAVELSSEGISITIKSFDFDKDLEEALRFPQSVAVKKKKRVAFAMDEFQRISYLDGDILERLMRSEIQHHNNVSYIFSGSKVSLLKEMFETGDRPFFQSTKIISIDRIPESEYLEYIKASFKKTKVTIADKIVRRILEISNGHPQRTKQICFEVWNSNIIGMTINTVEKLEVLVNKIIKNDDYINELWDIIKSPLHRRLLIGIAKEGPSQLFSMDFLRKHDLGSASHVQRAIKSLEKQGILHENKIVDPFFRSWILRYAV